MEIIKLHERTLEAAEMVKRTKLFENVGKAITGDNVIQVLSWKEAIEASNSQDWDYASIESINLCRDALIKSDRERYRQWNKIVFTIKRVLKEKFEEVQKIQSKDVFKNVEWVLMNYLVEKEYEDLYPSGYNQDWVNWYFKGHHICGWSGRFPEGRLVIY